MTTVSNNFTAVGVGPALVLNRRGKTVDYSISGTYSAAFEVQRALTPDLTAWETVVGPITSVNGTHTGQVISKSENDAFRVTCPTFTSGTMVTALTDREKIDLRGQDALGNTTHVVRESGAAIVRAEPYSVGAALSVTADLHAGRIGKLDALAGSIATLPKATGSGARFLFAITALATSNSHIIKVADSVDTMQGIIIAGGDTATTVLNHWAAGATADTITLNRTTTGSTALGEWVECVDIAPGKWQVSGVVEQTGAEATPFSATV